LYHVGMDPHPIAPAWLVLPIAAVALILQAGYLLAIKEAPPEIMPPSRKRIRVASGWLSMGAIPLSAYGFALASPNDAGTFTIVWMLVIGLIGAIVMLAVLDAINTMRMHRSEGDQVHKDLRDKLRRDLEEMREQRDRGNP
jgi:peptidoglycan/LPS O-acetylase OafA/YrhL